MRSDNLTNSMQQQIAVRNLKKEALLMSKLRHPNGERAALECCAGGSGAMPCYAMLC